MAKIVDQIKGTPTGELIEKHLRASCVNDRTRYSNNKKLFFDEWKEIKNFLYSLDDNSQYKAIDELKKALESGDLDEQYRDVNWKLEALEDVLSYSDSILRS